MIEENTLLDITNEEYHSGNGYYSSSQLKDILKGRTIFYNKYIAKITKKLESKAFDVGTAAHILLLEPELYAKEVAVYKGMRKGSLFEDFKAQNPDKVIISPLEEVKVKSWVKRVVDNRLAQPLITGGIAEKSIFTEIDGLKVKARFDYCNVDEGYISDLKTTTGELTEETLRQKVYHWGYHISAALYLDCFNKVYDNKLKDFYLLFVSKTTLQVKVVKLDESIIEDGRQAYKKAIQEIKEVIKTDYVCKEEVFVLRSNSEIGEW